MRTLTVWTLLALVLPAALAVAQPVRYGKVVLPGGRALSVEVAETPERRRLGYMFRDAVGPEDGMLFVFSESDFHAFWMKNVRFTLDILWLTGDGTIVDVSLDTPPCREDPCPDFAPMARSLYVLELAGGRAADLGLRPGQTLELLLPQGN